MSRLLTAIPSFPLSTASGYVYIEPSSPEFLVIMDDKDQVHLCQERVDRLGTRYVSDVNIYVGSDWKRVAEVLALQHERLLKEVQGGD